MRRATKGPQKQSELPSADAAEEGIIRTSEYFTISKIASALPNGEPCLQSMMACRLGCHPENKVVVS
jgi:hypothetical protein